MSLATFLRVHSNSKEVSLLSWQNVYPNLKTTSHINLKFFLWTKVLESPKLLAKYIISVAVTLNVFEFSCVWEIVKYRLVYAWSLCKQVLMYHLVVIFDWDNKNKLVLVSFSCFLQFFRKNKQKINKINKINKMKLIKYLLPL